MEQSIRSILDFQPDSIGLVAIRDSDRTGLTGYYFAEATDIWMMAGHLMSDFVLDVVGNNKQYLLEVLNSDDEDELDE